MATFRDDLARVGRKVLEAVEDRTGREIVPRERVDVLESYEGENRVMRRMLDFIGFTLFNYQGSQPTPYRMPNDMLPQARIFSAGQALRAWIEDPVAGQQIDLYVSFVFGRGVPRPQAHDDDVQQQLNRAWDDPANKRVLTSFERLTEKGVDLAIQSNVYFTFFDNGMDGIVRVSLKRFEDVIDVVRHPVDTYRILYYKCSERQLAYDYGRDGYVTPTGPQGKPEIVYYEAWDAFDEDDPVKTAQDNQAGDLAALKPPSNRLRDGKIVHLAVNKTSEMAFGVPRFRRLQRWFTAYNEVLESHVNRMKAMASVYMKQTVQGGQQRDLDRLAMMAKGVTSPFGAQATGEDLVHAGYRRGPAGPNTPGILQENESLRWDPFKIDSGASDVASSVPQLRAQISGVFPPTYYGQGSGPLAGDQALELPVLKFIEREQEAWNEVFRKFGEAQIKKALADGDLTEWRDPTDDELDRIQAWQEEGTSLDGLEFDPQTGQVKRDLSFDISLPSPLKRAMGDFVAAAVQVATAVDPMGQNPELSRWLFGFVLAEAFDVENPQRIVDQVLPRHRADELAAQYAAPDAPGGPRTGPAAGQATVMGPDGQQHPSDNPYGARISSPQPEQRPAVQEAARGERRLRLAASSDRRALVDEEFQSVTEYARKQLRALGELPAAAVNGNGNGHEPTARHRHW